MGSGGGGFASGRAIAFCRRGPGSNPRSGFAFSSAYEVNLFLKAFSSLLLPFLLSSSFQQNKLAIAQQGPAKMKNLMPKITARF